MPTSKQIFQEEFDSISKDLVLKYKELGMKASGKFEEEIEVQAGDDFGRVIGVPYTTQLQEGRKPTERGGDGSLLKAIEQWIVDKGIVGNIEGDISVSSLAFLITRKIHREGWKRKNHGGVELVTSVVTPKRMQSIIDRLGDAMTIEFTTVLRRQIKTILV